jgi:hypothetical protein
MLPRPAAAAPALLCRFVGPFTPEQKALKIKAFEVRKDKTLALLAYFKAHNVLYENVIVDDNNADALPQNAASPGLVVQHVESEQSGLSVLQRDALERDQVGVDVDADRQHRTVMTSTNAGGDASERLARAANLLVRRGTTLAPSGFDSTVLETTFPDLFPFGHGGLSVPRRVHVSAERCVQHYLSLSSQNFGKHATFVLVAKDIVGRVAMMSNVSLRVHLDPTLANDVASLSKQQALSAIEFEQQRRAAQQRGVTVAPPPLDDDDADAAAGAAAVNAAARRLLRTARGATTKQRGSISLRCRNFKKSEILLQPTNLHAGDADRAQWGKRVWSNMLHFGAPSKHVENLKISSFNSSGIFIQVGSSLSHRTTRATSSSASTAVISLRRTSTTSIARRCRRLRNATRLQVAIHTPPRSDSNGCSTSTCARSSASTASTSDR